MTQSNSSIAETAEFFTSAVIKCLTTTLISARFDNITVTSAIVDDTFECVGRIDRNGVTRDFTHTVKLSESNFNDTLNEWSTFELEIKLLFTKDKTNELRFDADYNYEKSKRDPGMIAVTVEGHCDQAAKLLDISNYLKLRGIVAHELCHAIQRNVHNARFKKKSQEVPIEHARDKHEVEARIEEIIASSNCSDIFNIDTFKSKIHNYLIDYIARNNIQLDSKINLELLEKLHLESFRRKYDHHPRRSRRAGN